MEGIKCIIWAFRISRELSPGGYFSTIGIFAMILESIAPLILSGKAEIGLGSDALVRSALVICIEQNSGLRLSDIGQLVNRIITTGDYTKLREMGYDESLMRISRRYQ